MKTKKTKTLIGPGLSPLIAAIVATLLISIISAQGQALAEERSWVLQERTLPVPAAASEALRDSIAKAAQPNVAAHIQGTNFKTNEEWVKFIRAADEAAIAAVKPLAERFKVTIKERRSRA